jgi:hypothetical protein
MNQKARFVSQFTLQRFLDFEDRYFNWMEGCVEPQHSRLHLVPCPEPLAVLTRDVLASLAFTGNAASTHHAGP